MALYRDALRAQGVRTSAEVLALPHGKAVRVAGWAVVRQRPPTANGVLFITLEDEEGLANLIVRPSVEKVYHEPLHTAALLWVDGQVQRDGDAVSVLVRRAGALTASVHSSSRSQL
jgi:error-prone DNA polymerase